MKPTISTYITTYNALFYQSTLEKTIKHATLFSDEIIVAISENTTDGTQELLDQLHSEYPNLIKMYIYKDNYNNLQQDLADRRTFALKQCTKDYCILQDDDEIIHEQYANYIKQLPIIYPYTIAFRFNTIHFYRSYNHYQTGKDWYSKKIYMIKNIPEIKHGRVNTDPDNFIINYIDYLNTTSSDLKRKYWETEPSLTDETIPLNNLMSPKLINTPITSYHYGWCRNDAILLLKKYHQEVKWHGKDYWRIHEFPFKFDNPNNLPEFKGIHPKYMIPLIQEEQKFNSKHIKEFTN